jgi:MFS family permease
LKSRTTVMISIALAMLVAWMDTTIMNTTIPMMAKELGGVTQNIRYVQMFMEGWIKS